MEIASVVAAMVGQRWRAGLSVVTIVAVTLAPGAAASAADTDTETGSLDRAALTVLGIRVGGSETLDDVVARLGPAQIWRTGDAAESLSHVCYRVTGASPGVVIWFGSSNAMSDPKGQVNHIVLYGDPLEFGERERCAALDRPLSSMATPNGLKLGMTAGDARRILGPGRPRQDSVEYSDSQRRYLGPADPRYAHWASQVQCFPDASRPYFDDFAHIRIRLKDGRAIRIGLSRNQSWC